MTPQQRFLLLKADEKRIQFKRWRGKNRKKVLVARIIMHLFDVLFVIWLVQYLMGFL